MKLIPLRDYPKIGLTSVEVIRTVMENPSPGQGGLNYEAMRKRLRVLQALKDNADPVNLQLEDDDWKLLAEAIKVFLFARATEELSTIIGDVVEAKAPPAVMHSNGAEPPHAASPEA